MRRSTAGWLGDYVIKNPIAAGAEWPVSGGKARIASVTADFRMESGEHYLGCIVVEVTRTEPVRIARTTFAPDLGPVALEMQVQDGPKFVTTTRARLRAVTRPGDAVAMTPLNRPSVSQPRRAAAPAKADAQATAPAKRSSARMPERARVQTISGCSGPPLEERRDAAAKTSPRSWSGVTVTGPAMWTWSPWASDVSRCSAQSGPAISR